MFRCYNTDLTNSNVWVVGFYKEDSVGSVIEPGVNYVYTIYAGHCVRSHRTNRRRCGVSAVRSSILFLVDVSAMTHLAWYRPVWVKSD